jgi:hypothetical protein
MKCVRNLPGQRSPSSAPVSPPNQAEVSITVTTGNSIHTLYFKAAWKRLKKGDLKLTSFFFS